MFQKQLLKLVNRLIEMTETELALIKTMDLTAAAALTKEKDPLVLLYQDCVHKLSVDQKARDSFKNWPQFSELKQRVAVLDELSDDYEQWIKQIEKSQSNFIEIIQEKVLNVVHPVKSYNKRGVMNSRQAHYIKQGGGSMATLNRAL